MGISTERQDALEKLLSNYNPGIRKNALLELISLADDGDIPCKPGREIANMHCHTFFSFNAYGYSPSGLAWMARKNGFKLLGKVDFDVLDGVEEFLEACDLAGIRGSAAIESRVFFSEFSTRELNSPGEPGIYYHMGIGLTTDSAPEPGNSILEEMRERAASRNQAMLKRLNVVLDPVVIDYESDVLPLTPSGNATERHILAAYLKKVQDTVSQPVEFWSDKLSLPLDKTTILYQVPPAFQNQVRAKLMKKGGPGYVQPDHGSFPSVKEFHQAVTACDGLICAAWLDGLSDGEQSMAEELEILIDQGAVALNIIPDRNWNVTDPDLRKRKVQNLYDVVEFATGLDLPINVGTEMNTYGQKLIDEFDVPELAPVRAAFIDGAYFIYGHSVMQRTLGLGYHSDWSKQTFRSRKERNDFFTRVGRLIPPGPSGQKRLLELIPEPKTKESIPLSLFNKM